MIDQRTFFRTLNSLVEPAVKAGIGSSCLGPGAVVVQTIGRKSGLPRRVPLLGVRLGDAVVASTVRPNSQWVMNLQANPEAQVWTAGRRRNATARVSKLPNGGSLVRFQLA